MKHLDTFLRQSAVRAGLIFLYILGVAWLLQHGAEYFHPRNEFWIPVIFLMLFVLSAAITGFLILGQSAMLYLDGHKNEALVELGKTIAWLAALLVAIFFLFMR